MIPSDEQERFRRKAIQVEAAQRSILDRVSPARTEKVGLESAFGRVAVADLEASAPMPHFRRSGMDGYAVAAAALAGASAERPVVLEVVDHIPCGSVPSKPITAETASRIMTGAMVPDGADAVVMLEMTEPDERDGKSLVRIKKEIKPGHNVSPVGQEAAAGDVVVAKGRTIGAGETALLAAFGYGEVDVFSRPRVAIFATGSELLSVREPLQPGKIRNSNTYMLAALVQDAGGIPVMMGTIPDRAELAMDAIGSAMADFDVIITTGGVSVGDYDIMVDFFAQWDGTLLFNKVTMRPGSPTSVGVREGKFVFALSGNPGACFVGFELFVRPALYGMQGKADVLLPTFTAFLGEAFPKVNAYTRYVRGQTYVQDGKLFVRQAGLDQSSVMVSIKDADCLIVIPPGGQGVEEGELVTAIRL